MTALKLWLDDLRPAPDGWYWVKTAHEAIVILANMNVSHISFDHDLGDDIETGYTVAAWIEERAYEGMLPALEWSIHSANPVGRTRMQAALENTTKFWKGNNNDNQSNS